MKNSVKLMLLGAAGYFSIASADASAQQYAGPLLPHVGGQVTTAFANRYGPDAEGYVTFSAITPEQITLNYSSTRGLNVRRNVLKADRQNSATYVLGYSANMPSVIPGTTSLGISGDSLVELRTKGKTSLSLLYDARLSHIDGQLTLMEKGIKMPLLVEDQVVQVPALHASGIFTDGNRRGTGDFYFLDNKNNPLMLESTIQFNWENQPRTEGIVRVVAGASMRSAMEQSLMTLRKYDVYGIHFNFDKSTMRPEFAALIKDIAITLQHNIGPAWQQRPVGLRRSIRRVCQRQREVVEAGDDECQHHWRSEHGDDESKVRAHGCRRNDLHRTKKQRVYRKEKRHTGKHLFGQRSAAD